MSSDSVLIAVAFLMASSAVLMAYTLASGRRAPLDARLGELAGGGEDPAETASMAAFARSALPRVGTALVPSDEEERTLLKSRLMHAGFYGRQAMPIFLGAKMLLIVAPA